MTNPATAMSTLEAEGWKPRSLPGFAGLIGPLWTRKESSGWAYGILTEDRHLNPASVIHGGLLMSLMDHALSSIAWESAGRQTCVTVQMDTKFLESAGPNLFLKATGHVSGSTASMIFANGEIRAGERLLLTGSAILKVVRKQS